MTTLAPPRSLADRLVLTLSSAFGLGYLPRAPGTWGTLAALPIWWALRDASWVVFAGVTLALTVVAVLVSHRAEAIYGGHDVQHIVIDEVVGMLVTVVGVPFAWPEVVVGFALFRVLDATKPGPIRWVDEHVEGGLGVVLDDVAAGVAGLVAMHVARLVLGHWW
jgi:phosphatidylglycerophosphatase A